MHRHTKSSAALHLWGLLQQDAMASLLPSRSHFTWSILREAASNAWEEHCSPADFTVRQDDIPLPTPISAGQSICPGLPKAGGTSSSNHEPELPGPSPSLCRAHPPHAHLEPASRLQKLLLGQKQPQRKTPTAQIPETPPVHSRGPRNNTCHFPHSFLFSLVSSS